MAVVRSVVVVVREGGVGARRRWWWCVNEGGTIPWGRCVAGCGWRWEMQGVREEEEACARGDVSRAKSDSTLMQKKRRWNGRAVGRRKTRVAPSAGGCSHVPCSCALQTGWRLPRGSISSLGRATRAADGNKKVGLFSLRVAGCSVLFF